VVKLKLGTALNNPGHEHRDGSPCFLKRYGHIF